MSVSTSRALQRRPSRSQSGELAEAVWGVLSVRSLIGALDGSELKCRTCSKIVTPETARWAASTLESRYLAKCEKYISLIQMRKHLQKIRQITPIKRHLHGDIEKTIDGLKVLEHQNEQHQQAKK